ncbi:MAG: Fur family transcriptional regulator [Planctomycetota bacterium]|nr:Fur family transcriptional regulator [Planctomycetota bacterium]
MVNDPDQPRACPVAVEQELDIVEQKMRERGYRWTSQRRLIASEALSNHSHFTADQLLELCLLRDQGVSRATVYRTLGMLENAGFVEGLDTGDGGRKFEHTLGHEHHDHMICTACGKIIEFHDAALEERQKLAAIESDFEIESHSLKLFGKCKNCRSDA